MQSAPLAMQRAVKPDFTFAALSDHIPQVVQLVDDIVPRLLPSGRPHCRELPTLSPSALAMVYFELLDVVDQLDIMRSPSHRSSAATVCMTTTYDIVVVHVRRRRLPPLPHFFRSFSSIVFLPPHSGPPRLLVPTGTFCVSSLTGPYKPETFYVLYILK